MTFLSDETTKRKLPPSQQVTDHILSWGIDHPGIKSTNPQLNLETYTLKIDGEVENPVKLSWNDLMKLQKTVSTSDFHCVEGWSVLDCKWEGVHIREIENLLSQKMLLRLLLLNAPICILLRFSEKSSAATKCFWLTSSIMNCWKKGWGFHYA